MNMTLVSRLKLPLYVLLALLTVLATGCATVTGGGNTQPIYVNTQNDMGAAVDGVDCTLSNDKGRWQVRTPNNTPITRSNKPLVVRCEQPPFAQGIATVESATRAAMFGNIIAGGVIGAVVDHTSGAAYEYPSVVKITLGSATNYKLQYDQNKHADKTAVLRNMPSSSQFADLSDLSKLPTTEQRIRDSYAEFLKSASPRAFAISQDNRHGWAHGLSPSKKENARDPGERALANCRRNAKTACVLYAVDDEVVYVKPSATVAVTHDTASPLKAPDVASQQHN